MFHAETQSTAPLSPRPPLSPALQAACLLNDQGEVLPRLRTLLKELGFSDADLRSGAELVQVLRREWWQTSTSPVEDLRRAFAPVPQAERLEHYRALGFLDQVTAREGPYQDALLMGGPLSWVRQRMANLAGEWERGVRFERLVMLTADRPLNPARGEGPRQLLNAENGVLPFRPGWQPAAGNPADEDGMMRMVFDQAALPDAWREDLPVVWVKSVRGSARRFPGTEKTIVDYLRQYPGSRQKLLAASSQPFVHYQAMVVAAVLAESKVPCREVDGTGAARPPASEVAYLDQLIRRLEFELRWRAAAGTK